MLGKLNLPLRHTSYLVQQRNAHISSKKLNTGDKPTALRAVGQENAGNIIDQVTCYILYVHNKVTSELRQ